MALSCARLESDSTDYVIRSLPLEQIVKPAVRKYAPMFISKKLSLEMSSLTATVLTDEKWAQFIVEQILSNSLKYTRTGSIRIWQKDPAALVIEDTGIGLYLCKEISRRLSHTLTIESEPGKGTRVTIDFATRQLQAE